MDSLVHWMGTNELHSHFVIVPSTSSSSLTHIPSIGSFSSYRHFASIGFVVNQFHPSSWSSYFIIVSLFHTCTICAIVLIFLHKHKYQMKIFLLQMFVPCKKFSCNIFHFILSHGQVTLLSQYKGFYCIVATKCNVLLCNSFELCMMDLGLGLSQVLSVLCTCPSFHYNKMHPYTPSDFIGFWVN
jgi:hypothetical protein